MRAVRDAGHTILLPQNLQKIGSMSAVCARKCGFWGIRGVFLGCGRITKADDVVDWIFGLMRAVRDTGPTMLLPQYLQKIGNISTVCARKCGFFGDTWCVFGMWEDHESG